MEEDYKPRSKIRTAISIIVPLLPILVVGYYYIINPEFREYLNETASEGFYSAKEGFEMLEFLMILFGGIIVVVILYLINVIKIRKITPEHQESILELIDDETVRIITKCPGFCLMYWVSIGGSRAKIISRSLSFPFWRARDGQLRLGFPYFLNQIF